MMDSSMHDPCTCTWQTWFKRTTFDPIFSLRAAVADKCLLMDTKNNIWWGSWWMYYTNVRWRVTFSNFEIGICHKSLERSICLYFYLKAANIDRCYKLHSE
jgi:hypothetical protein